MTDEAIVKKFYKIFNLYRKMDNDYDSIYKTLNEMLTPVTVEHVVTKEDLLSIPSGYIDQQVESILAKKATMPLVHVHGRTEVTDENGELKYKKVIYVLKEI